MCSFVSSFAILKPYAPTIAVGVVVILTFLWCWRIIAKANRVESSRQLQKLYAYENRFYHHSAFYMVIDTFNRVLAKRIANTTFSRR
jgi:hypothetical protein